MFIIPFFLLEYGNSWRTDEKYSFLWGAAAEDAHRFDHEFGPIIEKITISFRQKKFLCKVLLLHKKLKGLIRYSPRSRAYLGSKINKNRIPQFAT